MDEDTKTEQGSMYNEPEVFIPEEKMNEFREELRKVINKCSVEQYCNTPDFVLADVLASSFEMYCLAKTTSVRYVGGACIYNMRDININTNNKEN